MDACARPVLHCAARPTTAWRDGFTHWVMSPLEFMQRLAALVPRPRRHLIRFHGALATSVKLRALMVPQEVWQVPETPAQQATSIALAVIAHLFTLVFLQSESGS